MNIVVWDGESASSDWNDVTNWSTDSAIGQNDILIFNHTSSDDADFTDGPPRVGALVVDEGYTGTITLSDNFETRDLSVAAGTVDFDGFDVTVTADVTISGGSMSLDASHFEVRGDFTHTGGDVDAGSSHVEFRGGNTTRDRAL
ncbi:MAG: hypothetical protein R3C10_09660 [Pirellulales bacterium]